MAEIKRIYFVGIKGVGMTGLAIIAKEAGFLVRGSDVTEEFLTDSVLLKKDIPVDQNFNEHDLETFIDGKNDETLIITTAAHDGLSNPQCVYASSQNIQILTHGQAVGYFMEGSLFNRIFKGVSVLGCHGKTTVTAMISIALKSAGMDPTYTVGTSEIFPDGLAGHLGTSGYFVAEADEFVSDAKTDRTVKFLYQHPETAVINNIDFDHPDVYKDLGEVISTFQKFCLENVKENGTLLMNGDDTNVIDIKAQVEAKRPDIKVVTYGENKENSLVISNFKEIGWGSEFEVTFENKSLGVFTLSVPGYYNAKNSLAVVALFLSLGIDTETTKKAVAAFKGTKRRQEIIGEMEGGALVVDDYAHHPEEIEKTLGAVKKAYQTRKIVAVFQPHTLSRTVSLQNEFALCFKAADEVVFLPIFTSKREGEVDYSDLYSSIESKMKENTTKVTFLKDSRLKDQLSFSPYFFSENRKAVVKYIRTQYGSAEYVIVILGAGDVYKIAYDLSETAV